MATPPALQTERLLLRPYRASDEGDFVALQRADEVRAHLDGALDEAQARRLFRKILRCHTARCWAITRRADAAYVGHIFLTPLDASNDPLCDAARPAMRWELGYMLTRSSWGLGLATEAARVVLNAAPTTPIIATVDPDHLASIRVLEKIGMVLHRVAEDEQGPYLEYTSPSSLAHTTR